VIAEPVIARPILAATAVTIGYGAREIVAGVDLSIAAGERLALVGPNGAGKSTLLRALTGVLAPRSGEITQGGVPMASLERRAVARAIAVVPELAQLPFEMRVDDVVALGRLPHEPPLGGPRPADRAAVTAAIDRVGVGHLRHRDARELSMGERQLVFIAIALAQAAPILVLDEPTAHLDIRHQVDVMELLVDLNERDGTTIIAVLHDLALAAHFFPRIAVMAGGRIVADGPPAATLDDRHIRDVFGVDPALVRLPVGAA
jgi:iron complex transport system ATP-binding protein